MAKKRIKIQLSEISALHYAKLIYRSLLLIAAVIVYIIARIHHSDQPFGKVSEYGVVLIPCWIVLVVEMILRFFPSKFESMGCQKQFLRNYSPSNEGKKPTNISGLATFGVACFWIALNGVIGILYFLGIFDKGILVLISFAYAVCDMICILFFCPFHTWIMKNKCCTTCRIYNWDFAMMFTPLIFIPHIFTYSLVAISLALLIKWEIIYKKHPERFSESTNLNLRCINCEEKLCHHKKQLQSYLEKWHKNKKNEV